MFLVICDIEKPAFWKLVNKVPAATPVTLFVEIKSFKFSFVRITLRPVAVLKSSCVLTNVPKSAPIKPNSLYASPKLLLILLAASSLRPIFPTKENAPLSASAILILTSSKLAIKSRTGLVTSATLSDKSVRFLPIRAVSSLLRIIFLPASSVNIIVFY